MTLDPAIAAAERTDAARRLIAHAQTDTVDLVTISALDLCVLGAVAHPMFEQSVAGAWTKLGERRQRKIATEVTARLVRRGLLIDNGAQSGSRDGGGAYSFQPQLGLMLAARCRPAFVVVAAIENGQGPRPLSLFALGDSVDPVRGIVAELPAGLPPDRAGDYPDVRKLGPLGWIYRYVLVPPATAAEILAKWTIAPSARPDDRAVTARYLVSAYKPDRENPLGYHLGVRGDGTRATVDHPGRGDGEATMADYDLEGLRTVMLQLLARASR